MSLKTINERYNKMKPIILIDNGHGSNTAGKRSPDGRHLEYKWARMFASRLCDVLKKDGFTVLMVTPEETDVPISTRCRRVNIVCNQFGAQNCLLVSIHNDASGNGSRWLNGRGWSARVSLNASLRSKTLARRLIEAAEANGITVRKYSRQVPYWPQNLGICRDTNCPAVLTENLFMDNLKDVELLSSEEYIQKLVAAHVEGIKKYSDAL